MTDELMTDKYQPMCTRYEVGMRTLYRYAIYPEKASAQELQRSAELIRKEVSQEAVRQFGAGADKDEISRRLAYRNVLSVCGKKWGQNFGAP